MKNFNQIILSILLFSSVIANANATKVFVGLGNYSDQLHNIHVVTDYCGGDLDVSPMTEGSKTYQFKLNLGQGGNIYTVEKVDKFLGLPLYDYVGRFNTTDGRVGGIQLTETDSGEKLKILISIKKSTQDLFAVQPALIECEIEKMGIEGK